MYRGPVVAIVGGGSRAPRASAWEKEMTGG
jgi:hypothetical protein